MSISVIGFATGPRRHGNSEDLLDILFNCLKREKDVNAEKIVLSDYDLNPCRGCNACEKKGVCVINDDMAGLLEKIKEADIIVFSSPIFCMSICSQAKAFVDRTQVFRSIKYVLKQEVVPKERKDKRIGVFLSVAGQNWGYVFDSAIPVMKCFFHVCDVKDSNIEYLMINGVDKKGELKKKDNVESLAEELSLRITKKMRVMKGEE
ncbi:multimeric flavodoxin WrbA [Methanomicrobium sp. W14]|jgi:multimeric flavodoxin WrbA|uniref:flavodoxin family protein n=1 Tax=Methanomicrobium sp. W14 TaxID=2817839 RepID=UPI001AEAE73F|nr:flavodoxin family protein [Methanomicrobium sp. W14]MBP2134295.1 multimeric flavodoxin WrbA [Methanomicrobium sp. W14]